MKSFSYPDVKLIDYTKDALDLLLFTKYVRLSPDASEAMEIIKGWEDDRKMKEWEYMSNTIESSWEFIHFTFNLSKISRALTHQLVRTRSQTDNSHDVSFAQQSQRTVDMSGFDYYIDPKLEGESESIFNKSMDVINDFYNEMIDNGVPAQSARGVLPTNVGTSIIVKLDLRTLSHMLRERLCTRAQGEIQLVSQIMRRLVLEVYPWLEPVLRVYCARVGTCRFRNYTKCPIKGIQIDPEVGRIYKYGDKYEVSEKDSIDTREDLTRPATKSEIQKAWEIMNKQGGFEAVPEMQKK